MRSSRRKSLTRQACMNLFITLKNWMRYTKSSISSGWSATWGRKEGWSEKREKVSGRNERLGQDRPFWGDLPWFQMRTPDSQSTAAAPYRTGGGRRVSKSRLCGQLSAWFKLTVGFNKSSSVREVEGFRIPLCLSSLTSAARFSKANG